MLLDLGFLGDSIHLLPALWVLRQAYPEAQLHVMVSEHVTKIMEVAPWVDKIWGYPRFPRGPKWYQDFGRIRRLRAAKFDVVINLAAQAGVRYSLVNPDAYIQSNIDGFFNILEACRKFPVKHLLYASSSSVYGNADKTPFSEDDPTDAAVSLYAATKKSNELMAHTYSHLFRIPSTGLRFFTVYGPWGRPDMAYYSFSEAISEGRPITLFDGGDLYRDFTYVDDIVESVYRLIGKPPVDDGSMVPFRVLNLGNSSPVHMKEFIGILEQAIGKKANVISKPRETTDVYITYADTARLEDLTAFSPETDIRDGLAKFAEWYAGYRI